MQGANGNGNGDGNGLTRKGSTTKSLPNSSSTAPSSTTPELRKTISMEHANSNFNSNGRTQTRQTQSVGPNVHDSSSPSSPPSSYGNGGGRRAQLSIAPGLGTIPGSTSDLGLEDGGVGGDEFGRRTGGSGGGYSTHIGYRDRDRDAYGQRDGQRDRTQSHSHSHQSRSHTTYGNGNGHGHGRHHHHHQMHTHTHAHTRPKHTVIPTLPTSLDAAAALIASSSLPSSSHPHPHSQSPNGISISNGNGFRPPNSPARTPPKTNANASGNAKGETQIQSPNHLYVDRPSRKSTSSASRDREHFSHSVHGHGHGHTIGFGLGGLANLATKMNTHKSQPDLHAHVHALDGVGGMSPSKVKMKGKEVVISSPLFQRRGTGGTCSLIHTYTFLLSGR